GTPTWFAQPGRWDDPYPAYREQRSRAPVLELPDGLIVLSRHAEQQAILHDPRWSSNPQHIERPVLPEDAMVSPLLLFGSNVLLFMDPPDHTRIRGLVSRAFTPRRVELLRAYVERVVGGLLDEAADRVEIDLVADFAYRVPVEV